MTAGGTTDALAVDDIEQVIMTGEAVALELQPTPYVLAAAGAAIDWLVYYLGGGLVISFGIMLPLSFSSITDTAVISIILSVALVLFFIAVPTAVELLSKGKSLGRLAVGARIVRDDGGAIGFRHAFIRSLVALLDLLITVGGFAAIVGLLNSKSKRFGDYLAGTYSLYERAPKITEPAFGVPEVLIAWSQTADVARVPDRLALRASRFLRQAGQLTPGSRQTIAAQLASELSAWVSPLPAAQPELFVAAVVAIRRERELRAYELEAERMEQISPTLQALPHSFPRR